MLNLQKGRPLAGAASKFSLTENYSSLAKCLMVRTIWLV